LDCFVEWSKIDVDTWAKIINVLQSSPSIGPPLANCKEWKPHTFDDSGCQGRFDTGVREKNQFGSFVELVFAARRRSIILYNKLDCAKQDCNLKYVSVNSNRTMRSGKIKSGDVSASIMGMFDEECVVVAIYLSCLQLPTHDQRVTVVFEVVPANSRRAEDINGWANIIGRMYGCIHDGKVACGPAHIFQECSPRRTFKGMVDVFSQVAILTLGHAMPVSNPCLKKHSYLPSWTLTRLDKKGNYAVEYIL